MKRKISKVTLLLLLLSPAFILSSCSSDNPTDSKKTVTVKYKIWTNAGTDHVSGADGSGIKELREYIETEMDAVSSIHKKVWTITETADTEEAATAACDKKAIAEFDQKIAAINVACASIKTKFDAKKAELLPKISTESNKTRVVYKDYGGRLLKEKSSSNEIIKEGNTVNLSAIGGDNI